MLFLRGAVPLWATGAPPAQQCGRSCEFESANRTESAANDRASTLRAQGSVTVRFGAAGLYQTPPEPRRAGLRRPRRADKNALPGVLLCAGWSGQIGEGEGITETATGVAINRGLRRGVLLGTLLGPPVTS